MAVPEAVDAGRQKRTAKKEREISRPSWCTREEKAVENENERARERERERVKGVEAGCRESARGI